MNQQITSRRLLRLAAFLKTLPRDRFDYGAWVGDGWKGAKDLSCGTTGCALGWAAAMPFFRRLGLRLKKGSYGTGYVALGSSRVGPWGSLAAGQKVFGLSSEEAAFLFVPGEWLDDQVAPLGDATPKEVARHIERFVKSLPKWRAAAAESMPPEPSDLNHLRSEMEA